jgi:molybdenum cofactor biosynthesis enzyme
LTVYDPAKASDTAISVTEIPLREKTTDPV